MRIRELITSLTSRRLCGNLFLLVQSADNARFRWVMKARLLSEMRSVSQSEDAGYLTGFCCRARSCSFRIG